MGKLFLIELPVDQPPTAFGSAEPPLVPPRTNKGKAPVEESPHGPEGRFILSPNLYRGKKLFLQASYLVVKSLSLGLDLFQGSF